MLGGDWLEHWKAGGDEDHGSIEDDSRAMVRSHLICQVFTSKIVYFSHNDLHNLPCSYRGATNKIFPSVENQKESPLSFV